MIRSVFSLFFRIDVLFFFQIPVKYHDIHWFFFVISRVTRLFYPFLVVLCNQTVFSVHRLRRKLAFPKSILGPSLASRFLGSTTYRANVQTEKHQLHAQATAFISNEKKTHLKYYTLPLIMQFSDIQNKLSLLFYSWLWP